MATPPNLPPGDEPRPGRSWYPAPSSPRSTPRVEPDESSPDAGRGDGAPPPARPSAPPAPRSVPAAPGVTGPHFPPLPPSTGAGAPAPPETSGDDRPTGLDPDLNVLPPVPPKSPPRHATRRERRLAAESRSRNGRNARDTRRRWPWVLGLFAVVLAIAAGGILWRNRSSDTTVPITDPQQVELLRAGGVPTSLRDDCTGVSALPAGAIAAIRCTPSDGATRVTYFQYPTTAALDAAFAQRIEGTGVTRNSPDDCSDVVDVAHPYITAQTVSGNVACFREQGKSVLAWTMTATSTLGVAERDDHQDQLLYDWWNVSYRVRLDTDTEPTPLTPQQSDLMLHVPQSIRTTCQSTELLQDATASLACSSGTTDVFYTSYPNVDVMNAVYEAQRVDAEVPPDSGLAAPGACPGEGVYRAESPDAGRILCWSDDGSARATWTDTQFSILSEALRLDDQFPLLMTLVDTLGPS